jgi:hypothetical protein
VDPNLYPVIIFLAVGIIILVVALNNIKKANRQKTKRHYTATGRQLTGHRYITGQFSDQMELDLRLPYRRFKELYPESRWTYEEYKRMQTQTAFRRSFSSQDNKRMVR